MIYTKYSSPTSHRAQIPSSSDEVSSDGSELEFARSNDDDDDDSSQVKISKSKVVVLEEGGVCNQGEGIVDVDLEEGVAEVDLEVLVKQCVEWVGRDTSGMGWEGY